MNKGKLNAGILKLKKGINDLSCRSYASSSAYATNQAYVRGYLEAIKDIEKLISGLDRTKL